MIKLGHVTRRRILSIDHVKTTVPFLPNIAHPIYGLRNFTVKQIVSRARYAGQRIENIVRIVSCTELIYSRIISGFAICNERFTPHCSRLTRRLGRIFQVTDLCLLKRARQGGRPIHLDQPNMGSAPQTEP